MSEILKAVIKSLEKEFDNCSILRGDEVKSAPEVIPTSSISLNKALGIGGLPIGSVVEVYGKPGVGKTTLTLDVIKKAQERGKLCVFIDAEHALDPVYVEKLGLDMSSLYITQPTFAREALTILDKMIRTGEIGVAVIDSVASLGAEEEIESEVGKAQVALQARLLSQFFRRNIHIIHRTNTLVIFVNQMRYTIGHGSFYASEFTPGGEALKYYAHVRLFIKVEEQIRNQEGVIGNRLNVIITKNKHAAPFKRAEFDFIFGEGIDTYGELIDLATKEGILVRKGAWYNYNGENIGQGKDNCKKFLLENPKIYEEISSLLL